MNRLFYLNVMVLLFLIVSVASAQFGIKGGVGISDIAFKKYGQTPYLGYEVNSLVHRYPLLTFQVGVFNTFEIGNRFDLQPELVFVRQGLNYSTDFIYDDITYKILINYLHLPIIARYKISEKDNRNSGLFIGPYASLKLKATRLTKIEGESEKNNFDNLDNFDFGILAGFSIEFEMPKGQLVLDLRCTYSLINIMEPLEGYVPWYYGPNNEYVRNINISFTMGYRFSGIWSKRTDS